MFKAMKKKMKDQRGLTLVELLAVIVILGIIAAIAVPSINNVIEKSREDAIRAEALQIINAARYYVTENGVPATDITKEQLETEYLEPTDSFKGDDYTVTVSGNDYFLTGDGVKGKIKLAFTAASKQDINDKNSSKVVKSTVTEEDDDDNENVGG